jgi:hypothetical protein
MPKFDWQLIVAMLAVAGAVLLLVRRGLRLLRSGTKSESACGSCGSCSAATNRPDAAPATAFVPLQTLVREEEK